MNWQTAIMSGLLGLASQSVTAGEVFVYSPANGEGGLRIATRTAEGVWQPIGDGYDFVRSDFGAWGSHKKMWEPKLYKTGDNWMCLFKATNDGTVIGWTESDNLKDWKPQKYRRPAETATLPFVSRPAFKETTVRIGDKDVEGIVMDIEDGLITDLQNYVAERGRMAELYNEQCSGDAERFAGLQPLKGTLTATGTSRNISPLLTGIFFEDINYAADGGLYAELVQNRDFEYDPSESGRKGWGPEYAWRMRGVGTEMEIRTADPLHDNNPHYVRLKVSDSKDNGSLANDGWDGIVLKNGEKYRFTVKARANVKMPVKVQLVGENSGHVCAEGKITVKPSQDWREYEVMLASDADTRDAKLLLTPAREGIIDMDMISLFPVNTFKGRRNGLRKDLVEVLQNLKPKFMRFPGGCVAHGNGIDNIYDWKGSIGKLEERKPLYNLWGYHQTRGLGYYEYFQFCEDLGMEPLPVLAAGVPCQNSSRPSRYTTDDLTRYGQQCGVPMDSLDSYIQDVLDLIEYANGSVTSTWGAKRAESGHPEPFDLKYIGIGNEDMITEVFEERFKLINAAVKKAYPEITVVGTVGPFYEGSDYAEGWRLAREQNVDMVDEHYYVSPGWLIYNQHYYDDYDRNGTKVYLGEWAAHLPGRPSNMETALAEALYLTSVERNADVVELSSYAPLLAKENHTQWRPDLIYFNNAEVSPTTDYQTMRLFGENSGDRYLNSELKVATDNEKAEVRIGAGIVKDEKSGKVIVKLVNMLPVPTSLDVDLTKVMPEGGPLTMERTVMSGAPADENADIRTDKVTEHSPKFNVELPAYSFTVLTYVP